MKKLLIVVTFLLSLSCKKSNPNSFVDTNRVYVAGTQQSGTGTLAKYWKNGQAVILSNGIPYANSTSIAVSGTDVYISGNISNNNTSSTSLYWKNGQQVVLADDNYFSLTNGIQISGNDIYVAASELGQNGMRPCYWKNGQISRFKDTSQASGPIGLAISENDLYIAGAINQNYPVQPNNFLGSYLKNGQSIILEDKDSTDGESHITGGSNICVSGTDVYVAGFTINGAMSMPTYWKNGQPTTLVESVHIVPSNQLLPIVVSGNDIYVAGVVFAPSNNNIASNGIAMYWKNNQPIYLTDGSHDAHITGISVLGNDVYVSGYESNGRHWVAKYWRNGQAVNLSDGSNDEFANGIVALPK